MHPNDSRLKSFIEVAAKSHFPIQNLAFGVFSTDAKPEPRVGVAIGDQILDLAVLEESGVLTADPTGSPVFNRPSLNGFIALGRPIWREMRTCISELLRHDNPRLRDDQRLRARALIPMGGARLHLPVEIGDYTDFYSSREHATNVGMMFRDPKNALLPNWLHLPVGVPWPGQFGRRQRHRPIRRPRGQTKAPTTPSSPASARPPSCRLRAGDRLSSSGRATNLASRSAIGDAERHIFGMVLVNDWSARDIQQWEYVPLGPFLAKNFAHLDLALGGDAGCAGAVPRGRPGAGPGAAALPAAERQGVGYDIHLEVALQTGGHAAGRNGLPLQLQAPVLEHGAAARPSHGQRLQPADRRPAGFRHRQRRRRRIPSAACWN